MNNNDERDHAEEAANRRAMNDEREPKHTGRRHRSGTVVVRAYLNEAQDPTGHLAMFDGYRPGDPLRLAFQTQIMASTIDLALCEQVFRTLNVGDDPELGEPDPRAVAYRKRGERSLSKGDVVRIGERWYACASYGFDAIPAPDTDYARHAGTIPEQQAQPCGCPAQGGHFSGCPRLRNGNAT